MVQFPSEIALDFLIFGNLEGLFTIIGSEKRGKRLTWLWNVIPWMQDKAICQPFAHVDPFAPFQGTFIKVYQKNLMLYQYLRDIYGKK